jgi:general secretion pathway protein K
MRRAAINAAASSRGMALITALIVVALLVTIAVELVYAVYGHGRSTRLYAHAVQASLLASSAIEAEAVRLSAFGGDKYTRLADAERARGFSAEDAGRVKLSIEDEQGKVALNQMVAQNGELVPERFELFRRLLKTLGLQDELAFAVADWIDADAAPREGGAESDYYKELKPAYAPKNSALYSVEELLLVKGFDAETVKRLKPFVTVYTDGLININDAPREVIMALDDEISADMAESVIQARETSPFESAAKIREIQGFGALEVGLEGRLTTKSSTFRIEGTAESGEAKRAVEAVFRTATGNNAGGAAQIRTLYWRER